eukprot:199624_1
MALHNCRKYVIELDDPSGERWLKPLNDHKHLLDPVIRRMREVYMLDDEEEDSENEEDRKAAREHRDGLREMCKLVVENLKDLGGGEYISEMQSIAQNSSLSFEEVVMLHLMYEAYSACTAIVACDQDKSPWLARTMDWDMPELRALSIEVEVQRSGKTIYVGSTWAGYVGMLTAMRPESYAVAINFKPGDLASGSQSHPPCATWPIGFLVRHTVEHCENIQTATDTLSNAPCMANFYAILAGIGETEGCVLTRAPRTLNNRLDLQSVSELSKPEQSTGIMQRLISNISHIWRPPKTSPFLIQANLDHWVMSKRHDAQESIPRVKLASRKLQRIFSERGCVTEDELWSLLKEDPITDDWTIYLTVMCPAKNKFGMLCLNTADS